MIQDKKKIVSFIGVLFIYSSLFFGSYVHDIIHSSFFSEQDITAISAEMSLNETDALVIMNKIADWLKLNVKWDTTQFRLFPFYWRTENPLPTWVMSVRRGACEENAILFAELACNAGVNTRVVFNHGEDHVWNEVWINNSWKHFDATLSKENRFDNPGFYERSKAEGGWEKQLSYVYSINENGTISDVTKRYTETGNLIVKVERNGTPIENAKVIIKSGFLMEDRPRSYKEPQFAVEDYTDNNGSCSFNLGKNNYTIIAQVAGKRAEIEVTLLENSSKTVDLHLEESGTPLEFPSIFILVLLVCADVSLVLLASVITYLFVLKVLAKGHELLHRSRNVPPTSDSKLDLEEDGTLSIGMKATITYAVMTFAGVVIAILVTNDPSFSFELTPINGSKILFHAGSILSILGLHELCHCLYCQTKGVRVVGTLGGWKDLGIKVEKPYPPKLHLSSLFSVPIVATLGIVLGFPLWLILFDAGFALVSCIDDIKHFVRNRKV